MYIQSRQVGLVCILHVWCSLTFDSYLLHWMVGLNCNCKIKTENRTCMSSIAIAHTNTHKQTNKCTHRNTNNAKLNSKKTTKSSKIPQSIVCACVRACVCVCVCVCEQNPETDRISLTSAQRVVYATSISCAAVILSVKTKKEGTRS